MYFSGTESNVCLDFTVTGWRSASDQNYSRTSKQKPSEIVNRVSNDHNKSL